MSHIALYREWRPQTFSDVVAQNQVIYPLKQSIVNGNIGHAYLFSGTRGTGKTSTAKIFSKAVNCLNPQNGDPCNQCEICKAINDGSLLDVMEIDAASNNSVDNIRRITEEVVFMPSRAKYKVYIIDEVHMLSSGAFNALLKTLEEPPSHVIFILATTEPHRIPATVLSRCLRFDFRRIAKSDIIENLKRIVEAENIQIEDSALNVIAQLSDGAMRDAISLLDQAKSGIAAPITNEKLFDMIGIVQDQFLLQITEAIYNTNIKELLNLVEQMVMSGKDLERFITEYAQFLRNLLITQITGNTDDWFGFSKNELELIEKLANKVSAETLLQWIEELSKLSSDLKYVSDVRVAIEIAFIKLLNSIDPKSIQTNSDLRVKSSIESVESVESIKIDESSTKSTTLSEQKAPPLVNEIDTKFQNQSNLSDSINTKNLIEDTELIESQDLIEDKDPIERQDKKNIQINDKNSESKNIVQKTIWQEALNNLIDKHRIDLKMLLSPAIIEAEGQHWNIIFSHDLKAHYQTISQKENQEIIKEALQSATKNANIKLTIKISDEEENIEDNLNSSELQWIKDVRKMAKDLNIPIEMEE